MPEPNLIEPILSLDPGAHVDIRPDGAWLTAHNLDLPEAARCMAAGEATLSTISATALPAGETELVYHYRRGSTALNIKTRTHQNTIPSITPVCRAADWIEREIHDLYAVVFTDHPNLARLIRPPELPDGFFRSDISRGDGSPQPGEAQSRNQQVPRNLLVPKK